MGFRAFRRVCRDFGAHSRTCLARFLVGRLEVKLRFEVAPLKPKPTLGPKP